MFEPTASDSIAMSRSSPATARAAGVARPSGVIGTISAVSRNIDVTPKMAARDAVLSMLLMYTVQHLPQRALFAALRHQMSQPDINR